MKQKTADRITWALLAIGTALTCQFAQTLAAVILLVCFVGILAVLWLRQQRSDDRDEIEERAEKLAQERYLEYIASTEFRVDEQRYIGLGKGYK